MSEKRQLMQDFGSEMDSSSGIRIIQRASVSSIGNAIRLAKSIGGTFYIEEVGKPATESGVQLQIHQENLERNWKNDDQKEFD